MAAQLDEELGDVQIAFFVAVLVALDLLAQLQGPRPVALGFRGLGLAAELREGPGAGLVEDAALGVAHAGELEAYVVHGDAVDELLPLADQGVDGLAVDLLPVSRAVGLVKGLHAVGVDEEAHEAAHQGVGLAGGLLPEAPGREGLADVRGDVELAHGGRGFVGVELARRPVGCEGEALHEANVYDPAAAGREAQRAAAEGRREQVRELVGHAGLAGALPADVHLGGPGPGHVGAAAAEQAVLAAVVRVDEDPELSAGIDDWVGAQVGPELGVAELVIVDQQGEALGAEGRRVVVDREVLGLGFAAELGLDEGAVDADPLILGHGAQPDHGAEGEDAELHDKAEGAVRASPPPQLEEEQPKRQLRGQHQSVEDEALRQGQGLVVDAAGEPAEQPVVALDRRLDDQAVDENSAVGGDQAQTQRPGPAADREADPAEPVPEQG